MGNCVENPSNRTGLVPLSDRRGLNQVRSRFRIPAPLSGAPPARGAAVSLAGGCPSRKREGTLAHSRTKPRRSGAGGPIPGFSDRIREDEARRGAGRSSPE